MAGLVGKAKSPLTRPGDPSLLMTPQSVRVNLAERSYLIQVTSNNLAGIGSFARQHTHGSLAFVVTDENAAPHARSAPCIRCLRVVRSSCPG